MTEPTHKLEPTVTQFLHYHETLQPTNNPLVLRQDWDTNGSIGSRHSDSVSEREEIQMILEIIDATLLLLDHDIPYPKRKKSEHSEQ